jgi:hypothetical protein
VDWDHVLVAAFLRTELLAPELCCAGDCVSRSEALPSPDAERRLLEAVLRLYKRGDLPAALERLAPVRCSILGMHRDCTPFQACDLPAALQRLM